MEFTFDEETAYNIHLLGVTRALHLSRWQQKYKIPTLRKYLPIGLALSNHGNNLQQMLFCLYHQMTRQ